MTRTQQIVGVCIAGVVCTALCAWLLSSGRVHPPFEIGKEEKSPLFGSLSIARAVEIAENEKSSEYLILEYIAHEGTPQKISGWTIESTAQKINVRIPEGNTLFRQGVVPTLSPISLFPGERALLSPQSSPVGASFQSNICSPALEQFQNFYPAFTRTDRTITEGFYNDCVERENTNPQFFFPEWRVFLNSQDSLFSSEHDHLILKDEKGLIIAEYSY